MHCNHINFFKSLIALKKSNAKIDSASKLFSKQTHFRGHEQNKAD
jgi:hypothetical protein